MESWIIAGEAVITGNINHELADRHSIREWRVTVDKIIDMLQQLLSPVNDSSLNYGVRLEDIKRNPREFMPKVASWMGISDHESLYKSNFCGLQYWGPESKTGKITGFDTMAIDRPVGRFLGIRDIIIFETLFWPLTNSYCYAEMDILGFRNRLTEIRPWLDVPLEFEIRIYEQITDHTCPIERMGPYIRLHQYLLSVWKTLTRGETYLGVPRNL